MSSDFAGFAVDVLSYAASRALADCIDELAGRGCSSVQLSLHPGFLWPSELDGPARSRLRAQLDSHGIAVAAVNLPGVEVNLASVYPEMRAYTIDLLRQNLLLAAELGAPTIVVAPGRPHPLLPVAGDVLLDHFHAALDSLVPLAEKSGTALAVENTPSSFARDADSLIAAIAGYGADQVGLCYDFPNGHFIGEDIATALARCAPHLKLVHIADTGRDVHRHAAIGQGTIPFAALAPVLGKIGFVQFPVLEVIAPSRPEEIDHSLRALADLGWRP